MIKEIIMPKLGETMEEGYLVSWRKNEGDKVEKGEILFEVMSDKTNFEVESPYS
ncbi:MAG: biotin/lipoyl-containing protein, partial [Candidatus Ratteibacteria bacterium]